MNKINIAICGVGTMGKNHLKVCKNKKNINIYSIYDPIDGDNYTDFLLSLKYVDGLIISSPTKFHTQNIIDAININKKLKILCEKPFTHDTNDKNINIIKEIENNILIGHIERFNPVITTLKKILSNNINIVQIKTYRISNVKSREPIDVRKDLGIHDLDVCCFILNDVPKNIFILNNKTQIFKDHENLCYYINHTQIINEISWGYSYKSRTINLLTDIGYYEANYFDQTLLFTDMNNIKTSIPIDKKDILSEEIDYFINMITNNIDSCITPSHNLSLLRLLGY